MTILTDKERKALIAIAKSAMDDINANSIDDLIEEDFSWHNHTTIMEAGFSEPQAKGLLSSLAEKDVIFDAGADSDSDYNWLIAEAGYKYLKDHY